LLFRFSLVSTIPFYVSRIAWSGLIVIE
jgi:hypothetical protein